MKSGFVPLPDLRNNETLLIRNGIISQERVQVERYQRQVEKWQSRLLTSIEDILKLISVNAEIPLQQIYRSVEIDN